MDNAALLKQLKTPPSEARAHWHRAARLVMSLRADPDVDWTSADLSVDDSPVTPEEWRAWLRGEPAHVWLFIGLLEVELERPGIPSYAEVLDFVLTEVPGLAFRFLRRHGDPRRRAIEDARGAALGRAAAGKGAAAWEDMGPELLGAWLEGRVALKDKLNPYSLRGLNQRFAQLDGALAAVYPALAQKVLKSVRKGETRDLDLRSDWMRAEELVVVIKGVRTKPPNLDAVLAALVEQGTPQGLTAIAEFLPDAKAGEAALFWLAAAGARGLQAAHARWDGVKGKKAARAREQVARLASLPLGAPPLSGPRHRLPSDLSPWIPPTEPSPEGPSEPALSRERYCDLCRGWSTPKATRADLSDAEWADYLQLASMDAHLTRPGPSWDRAAEAGWLGRGGDPRFLLAAARRADPSGRTHWSQSSKIGWGHLLLWAGADREVYVAALALALRKESLRRTLGWVEEHWLQPLKDLKPSWRASAKDFIDRVGQSRPMLGPVAEEPEGPSVRWSSAEHALTAEVPPGGSATLQLGAQRVHIAPSEGTLTLEGPVAGRRRFPPTEAALPLFVTLGNEGSLFGFGSVTWGELQEAPGTWSAEGLRAVALHPEVQPMWWALQRLLLGNVQGAGWLAESGSTDAARLLTLVALLRPELAPEAVRGALGQLGPLAAPYLPLLGEPVAPPTLPERAFADVEAALEARFDRPLVRQEGWSWAKGRGVKDRGFHGPALRLLDGELADTDTLREALDSLPIAPYGESLGMEQREVIGVRQWTWRLLPPDGGFGNGPLFYQLYAAAWPVTEGWALALWSGYDLGSVEWLFGVPFLPAGGWTKTEGSP